MRKIVISAIARRGRGMGSPLKMKIRAGLMGLAAVLCALPVARAADTNAAAAAAAGNPIIARGTGFEITRGDLDDTLAGEKQNVPAAQLIRFESEVLNDMINTRLLLAKATDADRQAAQKVVDLQVTAAVENLGSQAALDDKLKAAGTTEDALRAKLMKEATAQAVLKRELNITITDDEVKQYYDSHTADFEQPEMARISHILIFTVDPMTGAALPAAEQLSRRQVADQLVKAAREGADFLTLARQYSQDPGSRDGGGELPPFPRGEMAPEIDAAAFSLTNNQVSAVITTSIGYQIIKLMERIPSKKEGYLAAIADIRQGLTQQKTRQLGAVYLANLQKAAAVEILDPSMKAAMAAGNAPAPPATAAKP